MRPGATRCLCGSARAVRAALTIAALRLTSKIRNSWSFLSPRRQRGSHLVVLRIPQEQLTNRGTCSVGPQHLTGRARAYSLRPPEPAPEKRCRSGSHLVVLRIPQEQLTNRGTCSVGPQHLTGRARAYSLRPPEPAPEKRC